MAYDVQQLLNFATGIVGDWEQKNGIAKWLFPEVPVMTEKFFYKNYGTGNAFKSFDTRRAIGKDQRLALDDVGTQEAGRNCPAHRAAPDDSGVSHGALLHKERNIEQPTGGPRLSIDVCLFGIQTGY